MNRKQKKERLKGLKGQAGKFRDRHVAREKAAQQQANEALARWRAAEEAVRVAEIAKQEVIEQARRERLAIYNTPKTTEDAW